MLPEVTKLFNDNFHNLDSCFHSKTTIPVDKLKAAKASHGLDHTVSVLLLIDLTIFGSATDSTLFTDVGISFFNETFGMEEPLFIRYEEIKNVEYKDGEFIFILENGNNVPVDDEFFIYNRDQVNKYSKIFTNFINDIAKLYINQDSIYWDELQKYVQSEDHEKILELTTKYLEDNGEEGEYSLESFYLKALALFDAEKFNEALEDIEVAEELCQSDDDYLINILIAKIDICNSLDEYEEAIKALITCSQLSTDKKFLKKLNEVLFETYTNFKNEFLKLEKNDKNIIYVADNIKYISEHFKSLIRKDLPEINFPVGHPIDDHFYLAHPYLENKYIPMQNYENLLFSDKVRELSYILQCLGATDIEIDSLKGSSVEAVSNYSLDLNANGNVKIHSGSVSKNSKSDSVNSSKSLSQLATKQKFTPTKKPYLPESLIWYHHEPEWQQIYQQRTNGHLDSYSIIIRNQFSQLDKENIFNKVKAEYENLIIKVDGGFSQNISKQFKEEGFTEWKLEVKFAPIDKLNEENYISPKSITSVSKEEEDYIEMYKDAFEDNTISDDERKLLDKKRDKLKISKERAEELERLALKNLNNFTSQEEEYIEMLRDSFDDGVISNDERNLINKKRERLGISIDRANELERLIIG